MDGWMDGRTDGADGVVGSTGICTTFKTGGVTSISHQTLRLVTMSCIGTTVGRVVLSLRKQTSFFLPASLPPLPRGRRALRSAQRQPRAAG
eukprot:7114444-Prymnesium_polylepis.1